MIIKILIIFAILIGGTILFLPEELKPISENSSNPEKEPTESSDLKKYDLKNIENKIREIIPKTPEK